MHTANVFATACKTKPLKVDSAGKKRINCLVTQAPKHMTLSKSLCYLPVVTGNKNISLICHDDKRPVKHKVGAPDTCGIRTAMLYLYNSYKKEMWRVDFFYLHKVTVYFKTVRWRAKDRLLRPQMGITNKTRLIICYVPLPVHIFCQ